MTTSSKSSPQQPDFDPTAELWDRLGDQLEKGESPCFETVKDLLAKSCQVPSPPEEPGERE